MVLGVFEWWDDVYWDSVSLLVFLAQEMLTIDSLAMAEITVLTAAVYRRYRTSLKEGTEDLSPGITSRFELFYDEMLPEVKVSSVF